MKLLNRTVKSQPAIMPIEEYPEYRSVQEVVDRLKRERDAIAAEKTDLINRANQYRRPSVEILSAAYLRGPRPSLEEDGISSSKRIGELGLRFNALTLAIQTAERKVNEVRWRLSGDTAKEQASSYRSYAREVLLGMLKIQQGNSQITDMMENRKELGYSEIFTPVGLSPWPLWGDPKEESSVWRMILKQFLEAGHISPAEHNRIISGLLMDFEP